MTTSETPNRVADGIEPTPGNASGMPGNPQSSSVFHPEWFSVSIMRKSLALVILAVTMCGCKTALIYTSSVRTGDDQKAMEVSKVLEEEYVRQGLQREYVTSPPTKAYYWTSWVTPVGSTRYIALWVGDWVKDGTLFIRIVPQPYCNEASRDFGEHIRGFMTTKFPDLEWTLTARSELDWFR